MTMPWPVEPMTAVTGDLPDDTARWGLELKWDGVRVLTGVSADGVRAVSRRGADVLSHYPELSGLADLLPHHDVVLDGEVVAFEDGRPSFARLQRRMHVARPGPRLIREVPVRYVAFDLLFLDGRTLFDTPYAERRALLAELELAATGPVEVPPYLDGSDRAQVTELMAFTQEQGLEGLMAKRLDSPYRSGRRVDFWRKIKNFHTQEVVVCGWKPGRGRREGGVGSLLLGEYDPKGRLCFVGHVGTGFSDRALDELYEALWPLRRPDSPFDDEVPRDVARDAQWVEPRLVGEVAYAVRTRDDRLRFPSWRGLRDDKDPQEVTREP
ncbi:non-homologous end-joining DNA ligase [Actinomadura rupiterrae]|uniref:non-homologous end-joining DNA ligase n=1 Tax=Actinomadura rupiterrae TaxID=559627 RepID=UPI0020A3E37F|nr:non-homologous end-joining DNA ligase [Actinomadura rupiterrae]MCP2336483.1 bifunctional non-homologous end joining protein LigD [Actinomadura rupiterrae]